MFGSIGPQELLLILLILLIIFGAKKLPQLGEAIGKAIKNFKKEISEVKKDDDVICHKCGLKLEKEDNFCKKCGEAIKK